MPCGKLIVIPLDPGTPGSPVTRVFVFGNMKCLFSHFSFFSPSGFGNVASNRRLMIDSLPMQEEETRFLYWHSVVGMVWWQNCYVLFGGDLALVGSVGIIAIWHRAERLKKLIILKCLKEGFRAQPWEHYNPAKAQYDLKGHCSVSVISSLCLETFFILQTKLYLFWIRWYEVWKKHCGLLHKLAFQRAIESEQISVGSVGRG